MARTFAMVSDLKTQGIAWVSYKNGAMSSDNDQPRILQSYEIAGMYRQKYASDVKRVTF